MKLYAEDTVANLSFLVVVVVLQLVGMLIRNEERHVGALDR
jgi:hypothetical protein